MSKKKKEKGKTEKKSNRTEMLDALERSFRDSSTAGLMLHQAVADRLGLHITDHKCMGMLCEVGPVTAGKLAEFAGLTTGAITSVINRLEKLGYAKRVRSMEDGRVVLVEATNIERFGARMDELLGPLGKRMRALSERYSVEELRLVHEFLGEAIAESREQTRRLRGNVAGPKG
ncbi:MarR family winged helix-turn-helix transcriptional regulator [Acidicapsa dinghuensis]|uniref:MarR family winged helix-turn-helix transcriptional regulator n=1 Tax=Acidicapsa dinghuensis TaxID=2218256 RepID=A0ABW1EG05_9BACT|nr:MarR family transcriptional regulator [Acidicapsa dinghuensis]